jgi:beta-mannanase
MLLIAVTVAGLLARQTGLIGHHSQTTLAPWPSAAPRGADVDLGVTTLPLARNAWRAWSANDLSSVNAVEQAIHKHLSIVMWYVDWAHGRPVRSQLESASRRGSIPEITWEPWNALHAVRTQPRYRLAAIVDGRFDPYIRSWATALARYGKPVRLRFAQEMNGRWYPWSEQANGNRPHEFVRAWRHVHDIFVRAGATNVEWVWSPAAITMSSEQYPGSRYVDIVSLSLFNGGSQLRYTRWRSFASLVDPSLARLRAIAPDKPIELSEVGCAAPGGDKAAWIAGMFETLRRTPMIKAVIWYDLAKVSDWRIQSSSRTSQAFALGAANPRYR